MTQPDGTSWNWSYDALGQVAGASLQRTSDGAPVPGRQYAYQYGGIGSRLSPSRGSRSGSIGKPPFSPGRTSESSQGCKEAIADWNPWISESNERHPGGMREASEIRCGFESQRAPQTFSRPFRADTIAPWHPGVSSCLGHPWLLSCGPSGACCSVVMSVNTTPGSPTDGIATNKYLWGHDISGSGQGAGGVGGLLAIVKLTGPDAGTYFPAYDGNGNLISLTDAAPSGPTSGQEVARFTYDAFGNRLTATGSAASATAFGFSTKFTDWESGLVYYGYRYLDPANGRWLSRDPIEEQGCNPWL